jgi:hypothetical protein
VGGSANLVMNPCFVFQKGAEYALYVATRMCANKKLSVRGAAR